MPRKKVESIRVHIRWMIRRDLPEILAIEQMSFERAWVEDDFLRCLRQRNCICMVCEHGEKVVGFMIYELQKGVLEILNLAVHPAWRGRAVGLQMVEKLKGKLSCQSRWRLAIKLPESNLGAQLFFKLLGLRAVRVLPGHFEDTGEDAFLMQYDHRPDEYEQRTAVHNRIAKHMEH